jgi:hypothetical protein
MSTKKKLLEAAAGNAGESLYVEDVFSTYLYDGNDTSQTITNGIDLSGKGGLVWGKSRNTSSIPFLTDTERGTNSQLATDRTNAAYTGTDRVTSFNSDGFALGSNANLNGLGRTQVAWTFRKAPGFFDIVTYTGDGVQGRVIPHDLNSTVGCVIVKRTDAPSGLGWAVWHNSSGNLALNYPSAEDQTFTNDIFAVTSTTFTVSAYSDLNASGGSYVAYLFAHDAQEFGTDSDESIIKCGSVTADGSGNVAETNLGWEPQWVLFKRTDSTSPWYVFDTMRGLVTGSDPTRTDNLALYPNLSDAETQSGSLFQPTATGFGAEVAGANSSWIYIAIRRPMKTPRSGTEVYNADFYGSTEGNNSSPIVRYYAGFPVDFTLFNNRNGGNHQVRTRLTGGNFLDTNLTDAETANSSDFFGSNQGFQPETTTASELTYVMRHMFKRAPGFFDVVAYTGNGTAGTTQAHNLGVVPELIFIKQRDEGTRSWIGTYLDGGTEKEILLNSSTKESPGGQVTNITNNSFELTSNLNTNKAASTYITYLFATLAGVSKVGSYTGTGADLNVDCGFSAGARFILIKRKDASGDWYVWDSLRGIVAGNDPYLLLNSTAAEVTSTDYIDPLSSGFTVTSSAPAALNASGGTYIFYAIA